MFDRVLSIQRNILSSYRRCNNHPAFITLQFSESFICIHDLGFSVLEFWIWKDYGEATTQCEIITIPQKIHKILNYHLAQHSHYLLVCRYVLILIWTHKKRSYIDNKRSKWLCHFPVLFLCVIAGLIIMY